MLEARIEIELDEGALDAIVALINDKFGEGE